MSDKKHTIEPWEAREGDVFNPQRTWGIVKLLTKEACEEIDGDDSGFGSRTEVIAEICSAQDGVDEADAERIVACVNGCAGLDPSRIPEVVSLVASAVQYNATLARAVQNPALELLAKVILEMGQPKEI